MDSDVLKPFTFGPHPPRLLVKKVSEDGMDEKPTVLPYEPSAGRMWGAFVVENWGARTWLSFKFSACASNSHAWHCHGDKPTI